MYVSEGVYTREVAQTVANGIAHLIDHPDDSRYLEIPLVRSRKTSGMNPHARQEFVVSVRLIDNLETRIMPLAHGGEIARCVTSEGARLDIMFGHPAERELEPALVLIEA